MAKGCNKNQQLFLDDALSSFATVHHTYNIIMRADHDSSLALSSCSASWPGGMPVIEVVYIQCSKLFKNGLKLCSFSTFIFPASVADIRSNYS